MPKLKNSRKARFRAALELTGMTQESWAAQEGVSAGHLSQVLDKKRESQTLVERIDAFTAKYLNASAA